MNTVRIACAVMIAATLLVAGCGPSAETVKPAEMPPTKEAIFRMGHQLYLEQQLDSAATVLKRSTEMDSSYLEPVKDLAQLYYDQGMRQGNEKGTAKNQALRQSRLYYSRLETFGMREADMYERLCELSSTLEDDRAFLKYAKKFAELYPYDRQMFNLGIAYYNTGEYQQVVKTQKEAREKFKDSPYTGGFYRSMGRAYRKLDRDQTAERTFMEGIRAVDAKLADLRKSNAGGKSAEESRRLIDDKVSMLRDLRRLHQIYKALDKLEQVERQLKEMGYDK